MNVIAGNVSSSQNLTFTRYAYGQWFNGTNEDYGLPGSKLEVSDPYADYGVNFISLLLSEVYINDILVYNNNDEVFYAESSGDYNYRDDGYGVGMSSYVDALNDALINNSLLTRFYPAAGNGLVGVINSKENFEIKFIEVTELGETNYDIKVESYANDPALYVGPAGVKDSIDGGGNYLSW